MQRAACPRNGTGLQASARPARGDPVSLVYKSIFITCELDSPPERHPGESRDPVTFVVNKQPQTLSDQNEHRNPAP